MTMSVLIDIKYALRLLFKAPKFTAMTLGVLIGGLSISLFTFSFLYSTVYKPLPLPEGETALAVSVDMKGKYRYIAYHEYIAIKDNLSSFSEFGVYDRKSVRFSVEDAGKNISGGYVDGGFFHFSRTQPILGRVIQHHDTLVSAEPVVVISYDTWQSEFAGRDDVLGQTMILNDVVTHVVGVMPQGFRFPNHEHLWLPLSEQDLSIDVLFPSHLYAYARVKEGVSLEQAKLELGQAINQVYQQYVKDFALEPFEKKARLLSFPMAQTGGEGGIAFGFLNALTFMILLLACINVGNLLLARAMERQKETAIRAALGATSKRLVSQLMWEGILISVLGGVLSVLLVGAALDYTDMMLRSWIPGGGSFWWRYGMDWQTVLMAVVFTLVTIFLSSFLPAWRSAKQDINMTLRDGTRGAQSKKAGKISRVLVTTQVFLVALLMLIGSISGFIAHKFIHLETGDNYNNVMVARMTVPEQKYPETAQQIALVQSLSEQIKQHPNVVDTIINNWLGSLPVGVENREYLSDTDKPLVDTIGLIGDTKTIGVNLVTGRQFSHLDKQGQRKVALISQSMANRYWPGESPLNKSFTIKVDEQDEKVFVVGVVTNRMNPSSLMGKLDTADEVYLSGLQFFTPYQVLYYRILPNAQNAEEIFYRAMFAVDRNIDLEYSVQPAIKNRNLMRQSMQLMSYITFGTGFFALLLAMVGIYGLTANSVAQRTHEVGIRRAVGASDKDIIRMFLKQGGKQLVIGLGLALIIFALISYGFHHFTEELFPVYMYFMQAFVVVAGLSTVVMLAIFAPTRRAVKMEPSLALRYE